MSLERNTSLNCLGEHGGWTKVATVGGQQGWVRSDLVSHALIVIHKNDRKLLLKRQGKIMFSSSISPGAKGLGVGRYFGVPEEGRIALSWPNRHDLREYLYKGDISYPSYAKALHDGSGTFAGDGLAICSRAKLSNECGVILGPNEYRRLVADIPPGARIEIYAGEDEDREINRQDELSYRIHLGARKQLENPAAGLGPDGRPPRLDYPGGDIQPDFATSADIVIRSVREAGLDLQALVHEDVLLHPGRYRGLNMGHQGAGAHRLVPVLFTYFKHNALSLPLDVRENPFGFEAGDVVFFASDTGEESVPERAGIVCETFNPAGFPLVVTVWDMGQSTSRMDLLGRDNPKVIGHFRMTHLFDYQ